MHPADRAFVEGFDVQTDMSQDFTNRVDLLDTGIRRLRPGGGTALFDSLYKTCRDEMLTLTNFTVDYLQLPYTQVRLTGVSGRTLNYEAIAGWPLKLNG